MRRLTFPSIAPVLVLAALLTGCGSHTGQSARHMSDIALRDTHPRHSALQTYSTQLVPVLSDSIPIFDRATRVAAHSGNCAAYDTRIGLLQNEADGVPHPGAWYTPTGRFHHRLMGVYHLMLGAIVSCQTASDAGDDQAKAAAIADMASAALDLHQIARKARGQ